MAVSRLLNSTIGQKAIVAVTGAALVGFVLAHMAGNLQIFAGPDTMNQYGVDLRKIPALLWAMRIGLLVAAVLHIRFTLKLKMEGRAARPVGYARKTPIKSTIFSRTMAWSGLLVLAYAVYHLLHFTFLTTNPEFAALKDSAGRHDVYKMVILSFSQAPIAIIYIVANVLLGFHLSHGVQSLFQTLGLTSKTWRPRLQMLGRGVALVVTAGFLSVPIAVLLGLVK